jgi:hypothetical protein
MTTTTYSHAAFQPDNIARLKTLKRIAWLVDAFFVLPGTRFRFGLNSIIGLLPVGGDAVLGLISLAIVYRAHQMGLPPAKIGRMLANVGLEVAGGVIPVVGDLFDVAFKANLRNIAIIEEYLEVRV